MGKNVSVTISNPLTFDADAMCDVISPAVIGEIVGRMDDGIGLNDERMKPYSASYLAKLKRDGEDTKVDHRVTGLMLSQVQEKDRAVLEVDAKGVPIVVELTFGVGSGSNRNNIAAFLQTIRPWFGISPAGAVRIAAALGTAEATRQKDTSRRRDSAGRFLPSQPDGRARDAQGRFLKRT